MLPCHRPDDITQSLSNVCILDLVVRTDQRIVIYVGCTSNSGHMDAEFPLLEALRT